MESLKRFRKGVVSIVTVLICVEAQAKLKMLHHRSRESLPVPLLSAYGKSASAVMVGFGLTSCPSGQ